MKTKHVVAMMVGTALACGTVWAQQTDDGPVGQKRDRACAPAAGFGQPAQGCPCGQGPCLRQGAGPMGRGGPQMRQGPGQEGRGGPQMRQGGRNGKPNGGLRELMNPRRLKEAGATDEQLASLKKFADEQRFKRIDLNAAAEKAELTLEMQLSGDTVDEKTALQAADALSQARAALFKQEVSARLKAREILGTDVLKKLREKSAPGKALRQRAGCGAAGPQSRKPPCQATGGAPAGSPRE